MLNYKVRPAISTKIVLEYCDEANFSMPDEFNKIKLLNDEDLISMNMITKALEMIENNSNDNSFYLDFLHLIESRWVTFFEPYFKASHSQADKLFDFYNVYPGRMASVDWELVETDNHLSLVAKRKNENSSSKFDDLVLFNFVSKILHDPKIDEISSISTSLPFKRSFYNKYVDMFHSVSFESGKMSITVKKTAEEIQEGKTFTSKKVEVNTYNKLMGAANMIPEDSLDLSSLSFVLGLSPRTLQRSLKSIGLSAKDIIRDVKFNHARRKFLSNNCNIKKTALECGFKDQGQLTRLFNETSGVTPSQYKQLISK